MDREEVGQLALAITLLAVAGWVDAIGLLRLGHLFVSFMSGDTTQFAVSGMRGDNFKARQAAALVGLFVSGVAAGRATARLAKGWRQPAVLLLDALCLSLAAAPILHDEAVLVPLVLAMGIQNAAVDHAGATRTSLTYVTGTLVHFGEKIVDAVGAADPRTRWGWLPYLLMWIGLVAGAASGAAAYLRLALAALAGPIAVLVVLAGVTARAAARRGRAVTRAKP